MQKIFSSEYMKKNCGCYTQEKLLVVYKENKSEECYKEPECTVSLDEIIASNIPLKDKYWFVCKKLATKEQNQQIAIGVAEIVLYIYESKYPNNKAPRETIQAAKDYLAGIISIDELRVKRTAADAAAYAAYAAAAADAADAADAAAYAAYAAAAAAAYAATYAAYAAAAADAAYAVKQSLLTFLIEFCKSN